MEITLLSVGKISSQWIQEGINLFKSRIQNYIKFSTVIIPDIKNTRFLSIENQKEEEGKLIMEQINSSDFVVLMDEKGKEYTSREFADWMQKQMNSGKKRILIIIGGPYGFSKGLYQRANSLIALSKMTFTHEMAKLVLTEQIYRGLTILRGEPYHHD